MPGPKSECGKLRLSMPLHLSSWAISAWHSPCCQPRPWPGPWFAESLRHRVRGTKGPTRLLVRQHWRERIRDPEELALPKKRSTSAMRITSCASHIVAQHNVLRSPCCCGIFQALRVGYCLTMSRVVTLFSKNGPGKVRESNLAGGPERILSDETETSFIGPNLLEAAQGRRGTRQGEEGSEIL